MKMRTRDESHYRILQGPVVTEKSTMHSEDALGQGRAFVFDVSLDATKPQVRAAIEHVFNVKVAKVRMHNIKGKPRNLRHRQGGNRWGKKSMKKRAIVRLAEGQDIDFFKLGESS